MNRRVYDMHSHVLPAMDDGAADPSVSAEMLRCAYEQGVTHMLATPHFYGDSEGISDFLTRRAASVAMLKTVYDPAVMPKLYLGAEVAYFPGMSKCRELSRLCVTGTDFMLVEMPFFTWTDSVVQDVLSLPDAGITPIIAHAERYYEKYSRINAFCDRGILIQSNFESFLSLRPRLYTMKLLKTGRIALLGSDCHNTEGRKPNFAEARAVIEKKAGYEPIAGIMRMAGFVLRDAVPVIEEKKEEDGTLGIIS